MPCWNYVKEINGYVDMSNFYCEGGNEIANYKQAGR